MGAWAFKLFACDYDLDLIRHLGDGARLPALEQFQTGRTITTFSNPASERMLDHRTLETDAETTVTEFPTSAASLLTTAHGAQHSLYAKLCSNLVIVRRHLDSGVLATTSAELLRQIGAAHAWWLKDCYGPGYHLCMLNACAMTLGAQVSEEDKVAMRAVYKDCELMRDAVLQLEAALHPTTGYVNGVPWDFGASSIADLGLGAMEYLAFPAKGLINVLGPDHGSMADEMAQWRRIPMLLTASAAERGKTIKNLSFDPYTKAMMARRHPDGKWKDHVCGECGSQNGAGKALLKCAKCKKRCYCSRDCQKEHWNQHKGFCQAATSAS